jgi:ferredoxin
MSGDTAAVVQVSVDRDRCCGAGHCVLIAPRVFDQDQRDGTVILLDASPSRALEPLVREAAAVCPTKAIVVTD